MKVLKDIYNLKEDETEFKSSLINWYNRMINKTYDELSVEDVSKMFRQNILINIATQKAIDLFIINPYDGEYYDGGLIEILVKMNFNDIPFDIRKDLIETIEKATIEYNDFKWCTNEEKLEYKMNLDLLKSMI